MTYCIQCLLEFVVDGSTNVHLVPNVVQLKQVQCECVTC